MDLLKTTNIESSIQNNNIPQKNFNLTSSYSQQENFTNSFEEKYQEFYRDSEVSFGFSIKNESDGSFKSIFYMSNLTSNSLSNIKINFMVQKFVTLKVLSTSGNSLEPSEIKGIKKVNKKFNFKRK